MGPNVTFLQGPKVTDRLVTFGPVETDDQQIRQDFARRLNEVCDDMGLPKERGRQTALAATFKVTNKAARKWLIGEGLPELALAVRIANWGSVSALWLLQGAGDKTPEPPRVDVKTALLNEALRDLPRESAIDLIDNIRVKLQRAGKLPADEAPGRYTSMLEAYEREVNNKRH